MSNHPTDRIFDSGPQDPKTGRSGSEPSRPVRIGTVVWGLIVAVLGALIIIARQAAVQLDPAQVAIWLLLGAGFAMVVGGVASAATRRK